MFKIVYMRRIFLFTLLNSVTIIYLLNKLRTSNVTDINIENEKYYKKLFQEIKDYKYI